jgi:hypothetical protein
MTHLKRHISTGRKWNVILPLVHISSRNHLQIQSMIWYLRIAFKHFASLPDVDPGPGVLLVDRELRRYARRVLTSITPKSQWTCQHDRCTTVDSLSQVMFLVEVLAIAHSGRDRSTHLTWVIHGHEDQVEGTQPASVGSFKLRPRCRELSEVPFKRFIVISAEAD